MNGRAELWVTRGADVLHVEPIGAGGLRLGRAPSNDLVLVDPSVSGHHAVLSWDGASLLLQDLASRNGTTVDGVVVSGRVVLSDGARIGLGAEVELRVRLAGRAPEPEPAWEIELAGAVRVPLRSDRVRLGDGPDVDLLLPGAGPRAGLLLLVGSEVRLASDDDDQPVLPDVPLVVGGHTLILRRADPALAATAPVRRSSYGYRLEATLEGPTGPVARLLDPQTGREHRVDAENRATLLWLLGSRWLEDEGRPEAERGWATDDAVLAGLWGREGRGSDPTRVRVLLCRLRRELSEAGLDGACLEKRQGHLRLRLGAATIVGRG